MKTQDRFQAVTIKEDLRPTPNHKYGVYDLLGAEDTMCYTSKAKALRVAKQKNSVDGGVLPGLLGARKAVPFNTEWPYRISLNGKPIKSFKTMLSLEKYIWDSSEQYTIDTFESK